jgi:hypothetical protein
MVRRSLTAIGAGVLFWLAALIGAVDDIDFFNLEDFRDRTELHHEHLIFLSGLGGLILFIIAAVYFVRELQVYSPPPYDPDSRERV